MEIQSTNPRTRRAIRFLVWYKWPSGQVPDFIVNGRSSIFRNVNQNKKTLVWVNDSNTQIELPSKVSLSQGFHFPTGPDFRPVGSVFALFGSCSFSDRCASGLVSGLREADGEIRNS